MLATDMVARFRRFQGKSVYFSTGMDEHSTNVEKAARELKEDPKVYCDKMAARAAALPLRPRPSARTRAVNSRRLDANRWFGRSSGAGRQGDSPCPVF